MTSIGPERDEGPRRCLLAKLTLLARLRVWLSSPKRLSTTSCWSGSVNGVRIPRCQEDRLLLFPASPHLCRDLALSEGSIWKISEEDKHMERKVLPVYSFVSYEFPILIH